MAGSTDHTDIDAWKLAREVEDAVAAILERNEFRRHSRLQDQLARSSEGPPVHIAEGFSRFYPRENAPFVRIARGSLTETILHLHKSQSKGLITTNELKSLTELVKKARAATTGYLRYLESPEATRAAERHRGKRRNGKNDKNDENDKNEGTAGTVERLERPERSERSERSNQNARTPEPPNTRTR